MSMTKKQQKELLHDNWPNVSAAKKKASFKAIEKASKAKVFEYKENSQETIRQKW